MLGLMALGWTGQRTSWIEGGLEEDVGRWLEEEGTALTGPRSMDEEHGGEEAPDQILEGQQSEGEDIAKDSRGVREGTLCGDGKRRRSGSSEGGRHRSLAPCDGMASIEEGHAARMGGS